LNPADGARSLQVLVTALREVGVSHYDGPVPGWPEGMGPVKLIVGSAPSSEPAEPPAARAPAPRRVLSPEELQDELDRKAFKHIALHGAKEPTA
jgi:hypothetical protein